MRFRVEEKDTEFWFDRTWRILRTVLFKQPFCVWVFGPHQQWHKKKRWGCSSVWILRSRNHICAFLKIKFLFSLFFRITTWFRVALESYEHIIMIRLATFLFIFPSNFNLIEFPRQYKPEYMILERRRKITFVLHVK